MTKYKTAESVRRGHPDKLCDLIADSILDECLRHDRYSRCACEVMATKGKIFVCGEITCAAKINIRSVVREVLRKAGYNPMKFIVFVYVHRQSSDIAGGVDSALEVRDGGSEDVFATTGAGDQGTVYGYATRETWTRLPVPVVFANDICKDLDEAMRDGTIRGIGPDGKAQVTVVYEDGKPVGVKNIVVSVQHDEGKNLEELRREIISEVLYPILDRFSFPKDVEILINPSGRFVEGGPAADTGLTGRKLMVDTYTDEGISAVNTKKREGFNQMVRDALDGKIDLIVTKSVSRFARNTVDSLVTVRKLKEKGVEVYFEKENIYTLDSKGELLITIMSSLAQEESRSISENVTWGQRKRFADGKVSLPYSHFLGYRKGADGLPEIVPEEAETVRWIYSLFLSGKTTSSIASFLTREGIPTPAGKKRWAASTVESILKNEKYKGDALLQKAFTVDFLTKKQKKNEGEVPQYYVENSHPAIIDPAEWKLVQRELERRKAIGRSYSGNSIFSSRLVCGDCGGYFGSKVWHSTDKYRRTIWRCNSKFTGEEKCQTPHLTEEEIKARFLDAFNTLVSDKERLLDECRTMQAALTDTGSLDSEISALLSEMEVVAELTKRCIEENSTTAQDQATYLERYNGLAERYETAKAKLEKLQAAKAQREAKAEDIGGFMFELAEYGESLTEFDDRLWLTVIDIVTVHRDGRLTFKFQTGHEMLE